MTIPPKPDNTGTQYSIPAPSFTVGTTNTIGDENISDQLPKDDNGLEDYPTAIKTWDQATQSPTKTHTVFTRNISFQELPGADSVSNKDGKDWTQARSDINYTDQSYGKEI